MECPKWLLEAMARGEGVKCWVWDECTDTKQLSIVTGFDTDWRYPFDSTDGGPYRNAEPFVEESHKFKPFDKVLVRDRNDVSWGIELFESKDAGSDYPFGGIRSNYKYCIPYEGNEHLLGTSDDPKETK